MQGGRELANWMRQGDVNIVVFVQEAKLVASPTKRRRLRHFDSGLTCCLPFLGRLLLLTASRGSRDDWLTACLPGCLAGWLGADWVGLGWVWVVGLPVGRLVVCTTVLCVLQCRRQCGTSGTS